MFPRRDLTLRFPSESEVWELESVTRLTDTTTVIRGTMGIPHIATTGPILTERTTMVGLHTTGPTGIEFTIATIAIIIITTATKLT